MDDERLEAILARFPRDAGRLVVLLSGGIDSTTLLHAAVRVVEPERVLALSFVYGQRHAREVEAARGQAAAVGVPEPRRIDMDFLGDLAGEGSALTGGRAVPDLDAIPCAERDQPSTYVPNRNMVLLSVAAAYAEGRAASCVLYGAQAQDRYGYWDCTAAFVERLNAVFALNRRTPIGVRAPFVDLRKCEVVKIGLALGVDYAHTWTCYHGGERPCGRCPSCVERALAFEGAGVPDPLVAGADGR